MYVQPTAPRDIGGVIDDAIKLYRASFSSCWLIALIGSFVTVATVIYMLTRIPMLATVRDPVQAWHLLTSVTLWSWFPVYTLISLVLIGALTACQVAVAKGEPAGVGQALAAAVARVHWILLGIVFTLLYVVALLMLWRPLPAALRALLVIGWVIYGIYLWGRWQLWLVALFDEPVGTVGAMRTSWALIGGHWWRSAVILTIGIILVIIVSTVFGFLNGLVLVMFPMDPVSLVMSGQIVGAIERVFVAPMIPALLVAMYYDYKIRRQGGDLAARTRSLQSA